MAEVRAAYRALMRAVNLNVTSVNGSVLWRDHVAAVFRQHSSLEAGSATALERLQLAKDCAFFITSIREQKARPCHMAQHFLLHRATSTYAQPSSDALLFLTRRPDALPAPFVQDLLLSYNLGIRSDVREKNMNEWAASKVGLKLPQVPDE